MKGAASAPSRFASRARPIESIKLDAEIDATDQLEFPDNNANAVAFGIGPQLAVLECSGQSQLGRAARLGGAERQRHIGDPAPEAPLVLFIWSKSRVVPVRVTEFSVTEEAFDPNLNPLRAKVSLGLRVMSTDDLGFTHKGGTIFISHLQTREALAAKAGIATLASLGITNLP